MARFIFKLEPVLKKRKEREDAALAALAVSQRVLQTERQNKARLAGELEVALLRREGLGRSGVSIEEFHLFQRFIDGTKHRMMQADQAITRASRGVEKAMRTYLSARRQTRMIETLKEKAYAEFKRERTKKELKDMDDMVIMRARLGETGQSGEESA